MEGLVRFLETSACRRQVGQSGGNFHSCRRWKPVLKEQLVQEFSGKLELKTHISFDPEILPLGISPTDIIKDMHKNKATKIFPHRVDFNKN